VHQFAIKNGGCGKINTGKNTETKTSTKGRSVSKMRRNFYALVGNEKVWKSRLGKWLLCESHEKNTITCIVYKAIAQI